jgi:ABC-type nitrate/sulfonate/bicarbonate transport system ATPase subunit
MSKKESVTLDHVTRSYRRDDFEVRALDDVTLQIPEHSFVAIADRFRQDNDARSHHGS